MLHRSFVSTTLSVVAGYILVCAVVAMTAVPLTRAQHPWAFYAMQWIVHSAEALLAAVIAVMTLPAPA